MLLVLVTMHHHAAPGQHRGRAGLPASTSGAGAQNSTRFTSSTAPSSYTWANTACAGVAETGCQGLPKPSTSLQ